MGKIGRRKFLKIAGSSLAGLGFVGTGAASFALLPNSSLPIETKEGSFHLLLYTHGNEKFVFNRVEKNDLPASADAIHIEGFPSFKESLFENDRETREVSIDNNYFAADALYYAAQKEISVYYGDGFSVGNIFTGGLTAATPLAATAFIFGASQIAKRVFPRRDLFIHAAAWSLLATGAGIYSTKPLSPLLTQSWANPIREAAHEVEELSRRHDLTVFRNAQMSYKALKTAQEVGITKGEKPKIIIIAGKWHTGIEDFLKKGSNWCLQVMKEYPKVVLETIFGLNAQECAQRIASTRELKLTGVHNGRFNATFNLSQDPELYQAISGERLLEEEGKKEPEVALRRGKESYF